MGTNVFLNSNNSIRFRKIDMVVHIIIKSLILPFLGVLFAYLSHSNIPENRTLSFACFVQWLLPTSIDIVFITQAKQINAKDVCILITIQYLILVVLSNFVNLPALLAVLGLM